MPELNESASNDLARYQQAAIQARMQAQTRQNWYTLLDTLNTPPRWEPIFPPSTPKAEVYNVGEDRIDVAYDDWQRWRDFRTAPWWKRVWLAITRKY
jgi:hypothetical protein